MLLGGQLKAGGPHSPFIRGYIYIFKYTVLKYTPPVISKIIDFLRRFFPPAELRSAGGA